MEKSAIYKLSMQLLIYIHYHLPQNYWFYSEKMKFLHEKGTFLNILEHNHTISVRTKTNGVPVAIVATISKVWGRENIFWKALEMYRPLQNGSDGVTKWWACAKWMVWGYYSAQLIQFTYNQLLSVVVVDVTAHAMYIIFCSMYNN